jgi:hypothetical protein
MPEELEKSYQQVWSYLEAGEWLNAMIAAVHLSGLDPANKDNLALAEYVREVARLADQVKGGAKKGAVARLKQISHALPQLGELASFKSLTESVVESEIISVASSSRKKGIVISIIVAVVFALACNLTGYKYIQAQAITTDSQRAVTRTWLGIQKLDKPVDVLLLGDSCCQYNLTTGPVADRLDGDVINLGNVAPSSFLSDAWMLSAYISKYGVPKNVVVSRTSVGFGTIHSIEFMANPLLPWAYWDDYGVAPKWKNGEIWKLFLTKYGVVYTDADILRGRLLKVWHLFDYNIDPIVPSHIYYSANNMPKVDMNINTDTPAFYFDKFIYSRDSTNAIKYITDLARKYHFQLYFTLQPEWDEAFNAGLRIEHLTAEKEYLSQFTDETYVHVVDQIPKTLFKKEQMQNPNHLWHGFEKIYTEEIVNGITAIQNDLTAEQAKPLEITSISLDKDSYQVGDQPIVTINVTDNETDEITNIIGSVSCLVKPRGSIDGNWVARTTAVAMRLNGSDTEELTLPLTEGKLYNQGTYDLVVFLRQDVGSLSHETRIEIPKKIIVK